MLSGWFNYYFSVCFAWYIDFDLRLFHLMLHLSAAIQYLLVRPIGVKWLQIPRTYLGWACSLHIRFNGRHSHLSADLLEVGMEFVSLLDGDHLFGAQVTVEVVTSQFGSSNGLVDFCLVHWSLWTFRSIASICSNLACELVQLFKLLLKSFDRLWLPQGILRRSRDIFRQISRWSNDRQLDGTIVVFLLYDFYGGFLLLGLFLYLWGVGAGFLLGALRSWGGLVVNVPWNFESWGVYFLCTNNKNYDEKTW